MFEQSTHREPLRYCVVHSRVDDRPSADIDRIRMVSRNRIPLARGRNQSRPVYSDTDSRDAGSDGDRFVREHPLPDTLLANRRCLAEEEGLAVGNCRVYVLISSVFLKLDRSFINSKLFIAIAASVAVCNLTDVGLEGDAPSATVVE